MKALIKRFVLFMAVTALLVPGLTLAATGPGDGSGPIHDILGGTPFGPYTGVIVSLNGKGTGFTLDTGGDDPVVIFGLGPEWYWESQRVERPVVGDTVTVEGFTVDFGGVSRNIAMTVVADGTQVVLRDPGTGLPLWPKAQKIINRMQNRARYEWNHRSE